ncbi:MAG: aspartate--tRNA ligase [Proteobacteria bacterium]|nr:aspartate--tRNA ligase [Pseudomonadota bacterium]
MMYDFWHPIFKAHSMLRSHTNGTLRSQDDNQQVSLCGWIHRLRDLGGLILADLRDHSGLVQLNLTDFGSKDPKRLKQMRRESVVRVSGRVSKRPTESINPQLPSGEVEIAVTAVEIFNEVQDLPFIFDAQVQTKEALKLKYRYLDLRSPQLQTNLRKRAKVCSEMRKLFEAEGFCEVNTPILYKPTPEGARDFLVPSRHYPGTAYALPQSPQILKQLLMIAGMERYYQITNCFRDEDLRSDRQPEFGQLDLEASFITQAWLHDLAQKICRNIWNSSSISLKPLCYSDAMNWFGSDKPDLRFALPAIDITTSCSKALSAAPPFADILSTKTHKISATFASDKIMNFSRKNLDDLITHMQNNHEHKTFYFKVAQKTLSGGIAKWITPELLENMENLCLEVHKQLQQADLATSSPSMLNHKTDFSHGVWFVSAVTQHHHMPDTVSRLRSYLGDNETKTQLKKPGEYAFLWLHSFPLFTWDDDTQQLSATHHPFTLPAIEHQELFFALHNDNANNNATAILSEAFDVVCNGYEIGGGSLRIYKADMQQHMFSILGLSPQQIQKQFGFLIEALRYGAPPHGGMAFGLDRIMMLLLETNNIRDVIAFPKTTQGNCLMSGAPQKLQDEDLKDLHLKHSQPI